MSCIISKRLNLSNFTKLEIAKKFSTTKREKTRRKKVFGCSPRKSSQTNGKSSRSIWFSNLTNRKCKSRKNTCKILAMIWLKLFTINLRQQQQKLELNLIIYTHKEVRKNSNQRSSKKKNRAVREYIQSWKFPKFRFNCIRKGFQQKKKF